MSSPGLGVNAVVKIDEQVIGYAKNVRTGIEANIIKDFTIGSKDPSILEYGNKSYPIRIEKMFVDITYANYMTNETKITLVAQPLGTGSGKPEITYNDVVLSRWELNITQDGVVLESVEGEAKSITVGTQS